MYLNVFRHYKRADIDMKAYQDDAARMEELARQQKGFLSFRSYTSLDGECLSISEWENEADARAWARLPEHVSVQVKARSAYYESYVVYSCDLPHVRAFEAYTAF